VAWVRDEAAAIRAELRALGCDLACDAQELSTRSGYVTQDASLPTAVSAAYGPGVGNAVGTVGTVITAGGVGSGGILSRPGVEFVGVPSMTGGTTTMVITPPAGGPTDFGITAGPGIAALEYLVTHPGASDGGANAGFNVTSTWAGQQAAITSGANTINIPGTNPGMVAVNDGSGIRVIGNGSAGTATLPSGQSG
jgi:hypothetical protein